MVGLLVDALRREVVVLRSDCNYHCVLEVLVAGALLAVPLRVTHRVVRLARHRDDQVEAILCFERGRHARVGEADVLAVSPELEECATTDKDLATNEDCPRPGSVLIYIISY